MTKEKIPGMIYVKQDHVSLDPKMGEVAQRLSLLKIVKNKLETKNEFKNTPAQSEELTVFQMVERGTSVSELQRKDKSWKKKLGSSSYIILGDLAVSLGTLKQKDWSYFSNLEAHNGTKDVELLRLIASAVPIPVWELGKKMNLPVPEVKKLATRLGFFVGSSVTVDADKTSRGPPALSAFGWEDFFRDE